MLQLEIDGDDTHLPSTLKSEKDLEHVSSKQSSPRSTFIRKKFPTFRSDEVVLDNFACAFKAPKSLLLQGMLYLTDKCCYFYSPFNVVTLVG